MFISIFKSEMYHKLRTETSTEEQLFVFHYGESFILYVIGFVVVELSGILNVCLFNKLQKIAENNQVRWKFWNILTYHKSITWNQRVTLNWSLIFRLFPFQSRSLFWFSRILSNIHDQNHFQLNSYVKIGLSESDSSGAANTLCQHSRVTFPPNIENGWVSSNDGNNFPRNIFTVLAQTSRPISYLRSVTFSQVRFIVIRMDHRFTQLGL